MSVSERHSIWPWIVLIIGFGADGIGTILVLGRVLEAVLGQ
jgi:hypothetical protein